METLIGKSRATSGKNEAGRLRRDGWIPANLIQGGQSSAISVPEAEFNRMLKGGLRQASLFKLEIQDGDKDNQVYVKELQRHPVNGSILHVDFYKVTPGKKVQVKVGVETTGTSRGGKMGGAMEHFIRSLKVKATPESMKDVITVDVTDLDVGGAIYLQDLGLPSEWDILMKGNPIICKVARSRMSRNQEAEAEAGAEGEAAAEGAAS